MWQARKSLGVAAWAVALLFLLSPGCTTNQASASGNSDEKAEKEKEQAAGDSEAAESKHASVSDETEPTESSEPSKSQESSGPSLVERAMDPSRPLPKKARKVLSDIEFDPQPKNLTKDSHYWVSNEHFHHLFKSKVEDHGGIYMGVGTDQNYMIAAWAKSPILLMMDFDGQIRNVHQIYGVVFDHVDEPDQFVHKWKDEDAEKIRGWLEEAYGDDEERLEALKETLKIARPHIYYRLRKTAERYEEREIPCFLTDESQYDFIKGLWERNRVFAIRGDLTGDTAMMEIATALESLGLELGLLYLSNTEQYFEFTPTYRRNVVVQPFSKDSLVLRTRPMQGLGYPEGGEYHYNIQKGRNFANWMRYNHVTKSKHLLGWYKQDDRDVDGLSYIKTDAPISDDAPEIAGVGEYDLDIGREEK